MLDTNRSSRSLRGLQRGRYGAWDHRTGPVRLSPSDATGNGMGETFVDGKIHTNKRFYPVPVGLYSILYVYVAALGESSGMRTIIDHNDPATPTGIFRQWQLSQTNNGQPASASKSMLGDA